MQVQLPSSEVTIQTIVVPVPGQPLPPAALQLATAALQRCPTLTHWRHPVAAVTRSTTLCPCCCALAEAALHACRVHAETEWSFSAGPCRWPRWTVWALR